MGYLVKKAIKNGFLGTFGGKIDKNGVGTELCIKYYALRKFSFI